MTIFALKRDFKCTTCGTPYCGEEGKNCDCDLYMECGQCHKMRSPITGEGPLEACYQHMEEDDLREECEKLWAMLKDTRKLLAEKMELLKGVAADAAALQKAMSELRECYQR